MSSNSNFKKEIKSISAQRLPDSFEIEGETIYNELFLVFVKESGPGTKIPFLLSVYLEYSPKQMSGLILYEKKSDIFLVLDISSNDKIAISNKDGHFTIIFEEFSLYLNKCKVIEKGTQEESSGIKIASKTFGSFTIGQDSSLTSGGAPLDKHPISHCEVGGDGTITRGQTTLTVKHYKLSGIPNIPTYLSKKYTYLIPGNFDYNRDQVYTYPGSSYIQFVGTVKISNPKLEPHKVADDQQSMELFTFERTYLIFNSENFYYGIPIKINTRCTIGMRNGLINCKGEEVDFSYSIFDGLMGIDEMKAFTTNVLGLRIIISGNVDEIVDIALSRISDEFPGTDRKKP
ncbi:hypothetical protein FG379_000739 [Cryptosporidium bovis]|uniref:uncharacterized protein n=1 Tax=Cryptosporidium bovis TaxID=310047 RepID=UPI00351A783B|nr:hypothetical protein FG379_000739 [Cryptosporidium bovis]